VRLVAVPVLTPNRIEKRQNGRRFKENQDPMFTLTSQDIHGIYDGSRIRKLTPLECFRLQAFPDDMIKTARTLNLKDGQLYKMAGNAVTVNVAEIVARKLWEAANAT
jgi:DNA (cytosine-5)-methyltransferase 1